MCVASVLSTMHLAAPTLEAHCVGAASSMTYLQRVWIVDIRVWIIDMCVAFVLSSTSCWFTLRLTVSGGQQHDPVVNGYV